VSEDRVAKERVAGVFSRAAPTYDSVIPYFRTFAQSLVAAAGLARGMRVLDLACGRGACLRVAADVVGVDGFVLGVDLSDGMVDGAAADLYALGVDNAEVRIGDAENLDVPDGVFDAVVCGLGVFFFPDPWRALRECRRVLRPPGRFAASTFVSGVGCYPWTREVAQLVGKDLPLPRSPVLNAEGLREAMQTVGFGNLTTTEVEGHFVFRDVDEFLAWSWSTAGRRLLETLDPDEMHTYREACATKLAQHAIDGLCEFTQAVHLTVGTANR
jgi:ubiquinone/menaquinone biosynthesis C-methylase UbiE